MFKIKNILIFVSVVTFIGLFLFLPFIIKVKAECLTQYGACPEEIVKLVAQNNGKSLVAAKNGVKKNLKNNLLVSDFSTQFKLPNVLLVNILLKKPAFVLKNDTNQSISVDEDGRVLGSVTNTSLPTVLFSGNLKKIGEKIDADQLFALKLMRGVNDMYQINSGVITDNSLVVELPSSIKVIFPLDGDTQVLLGSLRLVYGKIEAGDQKGKFKEIDLRFKNPVLR